jgi:hypothetical protein
MHFLGKTAPFAVLYVLFMLPTYLLPFLGSNWTAMYATGAGAGKFPPATLLHAAALLILITLAFARGRVIGKTWLVMFPILAAVFDLMPGLSSVPLVVSALHILVIILGLALAPKPVVSAPSPSAE